MGDHIEPLCSRFFSLKLRNGNTVCNCLDPLEHVSQGAHTSHPPLRYQAQWQNTCLAGGKVSGFTNEQCSEGRGGKRSSIAGGPRRGLASLSGQNDPEWPWECRGACRTARRGKSYARSDGHSAGTNGFREPFGQPGPSHKPAEGHAARSAVRSSTCLAGRR